MNMRLALAVLLLVSAAYPQCLKDTDCKGDRICVEGRCVDPESPAGTSQPAPAAAGWGRGAAIYGFASIPPVLGLMVAAAATSDEQLPAIPLGSAATTLIAVTVPVVSGGASSSRSGGYSRGVIGARIASWVTYGLSLANAIVLIGLGIADLEVAPGQIIATGGLGCASIALMSVDALGSQRHAAMDRGGEDTRLSLSLVPRRKGGGLLLSGEF